MFLCFIKLQNIPESIFTKLKVILGIIMALKLRYQLSQIYVRIPCFEYSENALYICLKLFIVKAKITVSSVYNTTKHQNVIIKISASVIPVPGYPLCLVPHLRSLDRLHAWWSTQSRLATLRSSLIALLWVGLHTLWPFRLKDLSIEDEIVVAWCFSCLSGPSGFTCWIFFTLVFSLFTVKSLSLLYLLFIDLYVLGDGALIS